MSRKGRPRGSKNQPTLFKVKRTKLDTVKLSRECLRIVHSRAHGSGLSPQTVLEDLIMAGDYTMGQAYDNLSNFRKRIREKASERNNVVPITSTETAGQNGHAEFEQGSETVGIAAGNEHVPEGEGEVQQGFDDATLERGHMPTDNPAFAGTSGLGDVIGTVGKEMTMAQAGDWARDQLLSSDPIFADPGPEYTDEEGNPIEPQEVHEEE